MTVPFVGRPAGEQRDWFRELVDLGYTDVWSSEADGADAFTPLTLASVWAPELRLGTAIVPAYTRGPACLAQSVGSVAQAAPGRFVLGIGSSSNVIVERWNDIPFEEPYKRTRDVVRFLRDALSGEKVRQEYDTFTVNGFKLGVRPTEPVPILVAALREEMLRLAGREGDGAIINWLSADDVSHVAPIVKSYGEDKEVVARIFVAVSDDADAMRAAGRFAIAAYLNVPVYAAFHEWLGRGESPHADVGRLEGGRPGRGARGHPRRGRRPAHRPRLARGLPGAPRALPGQRGRHPGHRPAALPGRAPGTGGPPGLGAAVVGVA